MTDFKVGDRVRYHGRNYGDQRFIGKVAEVRRVYPKYLSVVFDCESPAYLVRENFELVEEPVEKSDEELAAEVRECQSIISAAVTKRDLTKEKLIKRGWSCVYIPKDELYVIKKSQEFFL